VKKASALPPVIDVHRLSVRRDTAILREVNWTVHPGEHWVILGANGSGKTSLLSALTGYLAPSDGKLAVLGREYGHFDWRELRKAVGVVSSSVRQKIDDGETALETVASGKTAMVNFWGRLTPADRRKALAILRRVDAGRLAARHWLFLSQGERQRVLIGRALMADLRLLILDEPCAGLDPVAREQFLRFMAGFAAQKGKDAPTLVLVTHHVEEILPAFTHVLILKEGRALAAGPVRRTLTSKVLSEAFGAPLVLTRRAGRYSLRLTGRMSGRRILSRA